MALSNIPAQRVPESAPHTPVAPRETAPYSRVRGGTRYTQVASTRRRRRNLVLGVVATVLAMVVLGAAIAFGSAASFVNSIGNRLNENVSAATKAVLAEQQASAVQLTSNWTDMSPFYMLLLGVDSNEARLDGSEVGDVGAYGAGQENYRTDTMILARVDPGNKKVALVSIHRDTLYPVDGTDRPQKINQAYSIGGVPKTIEVVSDFAGVPISHYAEINIDGLYAIVDALGGVEVDVPYDIDDWWTGWHLDAGLQTLNGEEAEIFTRSRHAYDEIGDGDRYRAAHQRLFLAAVLNKLMAASPIDMVSAINTLSNYVTTDLSLDQIINLALAMRGIDAENDVYSTMNPTEAEVIEGTYYEKNQDSYWRQIMEQVDEGLKPDSDTAYRAVNDDINNPNHVADDAAAASDQTSAPIQPAYVSDARVVVRSSPDYESVADEVLATLQGAGYRAEEGNTANVTPNGPRVVYEDAAYASVAKDIAGLIGGVATEAGDTWLVTGDIMVVAGPK